jgi:biopolymer transport protein ExbB
MGSTGDLGCNAGGVWALPDWRRRVRLVLDTTDIGTALTDVPVMLRLTETQIDRAFVLDDGSDLRFVVGGEPVAYEIEQWTDAGVSFLWFKMPSIPAAPSTPPPIWLYFDNPNATPGTMETEVWTGGFESVHHLQNLADSTGHGHDAVTDSPPNDSGGKIARARNFDGSSDYLELPPENAFDFTDAVTVEAWVRINGWEGAWDAVVTKGNSTWRLQRDNQNAFLSWDLNGVGELNGTAPVDDNNWHYLVATYGDSGYRVFVDGVQGGSSTATGSIAVDDRAVYIGSNSEQNNRELDARIDEVRISKVARSPDWVLLQYRSMNDQLITFGAEQICEE